MKRGPYRRKPAAERFWPRANKNGTEQLDRPVHGRCWVWTGRTNDAGYGTHCPRGHEYTPDNTRRDPAGSRHCRTCDDLGRERRTEQRRLARIAKYGYDPGPRARFSPPEPTVEVVQ